MPDSSNMFFFMQGEKCFFNNCLQSNPCPVCGRVLGEGSVVMQTVIPEDLKMDFKTLIKIRLKKIMNEYSDPGLFLLTAKTVIQELIDNRLW